MNTENELEPKPAVDLSRLVPLIARWRVLARATGARAKYAGSIGNYSAAHALDEQARQRFKCADELEAEMMALDEPNAEPIDRPS